MRSTPQNIWSHVFEAHDECIELWKKYELKGYAVKGNKVFIRIQVPTYFPELLPRGNKYYKNPNESDFNQAFYDWLDEFHQRYAEKRNKSR